MEQRFYVKYKPVSYSKKYFSIRARALAQSQGEHSPFRLGNSTIAAPSSPWALFGPRNGLQCFASVRRKGVCGAPMIFNGM